MKENERSTQSAALSRKITSANLKSWCSKMQPLSGNQRPDLLTSLMKMVSLYCTCQATFIFAEPPRKPHACQRFWNCYKTVTFCSLLTRCASPLRWPRQTTSESLKVLCTRQFFTLLTWTCCFAPQRRALFRHLNFQKWSDFGVFCTFWLGHVFHAATTACTFSTSQLPKVVRLWCVLYILTWTCVSRRHNGVHFFDITAFKKCTELGLFCTFWLGNVLRATTACTFSTSQLPKVVRTWCVLYILETCFALQRRAIFHLSSGQMAPHPSL